MRPIDQEWLTGNPDKVPGDCVRACVASILELDRDLVPHFVRDQNSHWGSALDDWCDARGIELVHFEGQRAFDFPMMWTGTSPRNSSMRHAVVGFGATLMHDPHPSRAGLVGPADRSFIFLPRNIDWTAHFAGRA